MLRNIPRLSKCTPLLVSVRSAGGGSEAGSYESVLVTKEIGFRRKRMVRDMIRAEKKYVASLPGGCNVFIIYLIKIMCLNYLFSIL